MKYLSIILIAAITLISCDPKVDACECQAAMMEAGEEAYMADTVANADCIAAMEVEGAMDACEEADAGTDAEGADAEGADAGADADAEGDM
tara:strand:- start:195 stop:467 length:273 start_codon:yes stop_codon:yes gene_type:complete